MSEIKPCPFCGGKAITSAFFDLDDLEYMAFEVNDSESIDGEVTCENERCINGWWLSQKEWNARPIEDALHARIAKLEAVINQLIEAGDAMSNAQSMWVAEEDKWDALVKDWKEREKCTNIHH